MPLLHKDVSCCSVPTLNFLLHSLPQTTSLSRWDFHLVAFLLTRSNILTSSCSNFWYSVSALNLAAVRDHAWPGLSTTLHMFTMSRYEPSAQWMLNGRIKIKSHEQKMLSLKKFYKIKNFLYFLLCLFKDFLYVKVKSGHTQSWQLSILLLSAPLFFSGFIRKDQRQEHICQSWNITPWCMFWKLLEVSWNQNSQYKFISNIHHFDYLKSECLKKPHNSGVLFNTSEYFPRVLWCSVNNIKENSSKEAFMKILFQSTAWKLRLKAV